MAATLALVAPVAMHRMLFRQHRLGLLVSAAHRLAYAGLVLLGVALLGVTAVVFDVVYGRTAAMIAGGVALVALRSCGWFSRYAFGRSRNRTGDARATFHAAPYSQPIPLRTSATTGGISPTTRLAVLTIPPVHPSQGAPGERRSSADAWW